MKKANKVKGSHLEKQPREKPCLALVKTSGFCLESLFVMTVLIYHVSNNLQSKEIPLCNNFKTIYDAT